MNLRRQLLFVSLLLLTLPWAGCQFIREMEGALRQGQEQSLQATAQAVAAILGERPQLLYPNLARRGAAPDERSSIYALGTDQPVIVDGYGDGWESIEGTEFRSQLPSGLAITAYAQLKGEYLYLLLKVADSEIVYDNPGLSREPNGDRLVLRLWRDGRRQDYVITTAAPGSVRARWGNRRERGIDARRIHGYWQDAVGGYTLELEIPLAYTGGRLGFFLINEMFAPNKAVETLGNIKPLHAVAPPWLLYSPPDIQTLLQPFSKQSNQIQVVDAHNWLIADIPASGNSRGAATNTFWLLQLMYRSILSQDALATPPLPPHFGKAIGSEIQAALTGSARNQRYRDPNYRSRTTLSAAAPIEDDDGVLGAVVLRQSGETYLSLTDQAFSQLLAYSLIALGIGALGLLGYASVLSWRIRTLSHNAREAIDEDGRVTHNFARSKVADEIGELSRHYGDLLDRVREYNDYLRTLSRKLSHEIRTPVAVIQTSLDNLEQTEEQVGDSGVYLQRARQGLSRLQHILTAMSEANQLEESIRNNQTERVDLVPLLNEVFAAYREVYNDHRLLLAIEQDSAMVEGVPELIVQGLDKLLDNAASFCPPDKEIEIRLLAAGDFWEIRVSNQGPTLATDIRDRLFDPMVSLRQEKSEELHLGLGLHILRLIADFHRGQVHADNLPDGSGVSIALRLPVAEQPANSQTPIA